MKSYTFLIVLVFFITSCKEANNQNAKEQPEAKEKVNKKVASKSKPKNNGSTYLCTINGKDWAYTKASGIVSAHARTKKRTAIITFKKKLEKGSEHLQLTYDADTFQLIGASLQLKFPQKDGSLSTCYYNLKSETKRHPESEISGSIDLSNSSSTSGTAEIKNININYEKGKLKNPEDAVLTITGLKFADIGYSDIDKLSKAYKKQ